MIRTSEVGPLCVVPNGIEAIGSRSAVPFAYNFIRHNRLYEKVLKYIHTYLISVHMHAPLFDDHVSSYSRG